MMNVDVEVYLISFRGSC